MLSRSGRSWAGSEPLHVMGTVPGCWGRFGEPKIVAVNTPSPSHPVLSCSPRSPQLHHAARRGREALQLAAAAGIAAGPGAADPGHPADLPGPAAAGGRDLLPAGEADHGAAGAGRAGRLALLAAAHLHELHVPALPACPALPALPPGQASATELAGFPPGLARGPRHCCDPPPLLFLPWCPPPRRTESRFPASEMAKYACFIREALGKTRGRECVPSLEEILVLMRRQEMVCTVHCPGAAACSVAISSHTTAEEVRAEPVPCAGLGSIRQRGRGRGGNLGDAGTPASARRDLSVSLCSPERRGQGRAVTVGCLCLAPGGPGAGVAPGAVPEPQPLCALRAVPAPGAARGQLHAAGRRPHQV